MKPNSIALSILLLIAPVCLLYGQNNRIFSWGDQGDGPVLRSNYVWFRGVNDGDTGRLLYSLDGKTYVDTGALFRLKFRHWKGSRISIFSYGSNGGSADFDYIHYRYDATTEALGVR
jgi:hypothetical protein